MASAGCRGKICSAPRHSPCALKTSRPRCRLPKFQTTRERERADGHLMLLEAPWACLPRSLSAQAEPRSLQLRSRRLPRAVTRIQYLAALAAQRLHAPRRLNSQRRFFSAERAGIEACLPCRNVYAEVLVCLQGSMLVRCVPLALAAAAASAEGEMHRMSAVIRVP